VQFATARGSADLRTLRAHDPCQCRATAGLASDPARVIDEASAGRKVWAMLPILYGVGGASRTAQVCWSTTIAPVVSSLANQTQVFSRRCVGKVVYSRISWRNARSRQS